MSTPDPIRPVASYRLQFGPGLGWKEAAALVPYLHALGISHVYASPVFEARSDNAYATVDYGRFDPALGDAASRRDYVAALGAHGLAEMLDLVPNHMAADPVRNAWWREVLRHGQAGPFGAFFDVDWEGPDPRLRGRVLLPILGRHLGGAIEGREVRVKRGGKSLLLTVPGWELPLSPGAEACLAERARGTDAELSETAMDILLDAVNADPGELEAVLERQFYRLAFWKNGNEELNYRRFFDILNLAGLRMDRGEVFESAHALVRELVGGGTVDGLRVDHIDGLRDPQDYLDRLRRLLPGGWIVVEKILGPGETIPPRWEADGTTGYDFLNLAGGLFVDPRGEWPLTRLYAEFTGEPEDFRPVLLESKARALDILFGAELDRFAGRLLAIARGTRRGCDFSLRAVRAALRAAILHLPVYRTYIKAGDGAAGEEDAGRWAAALAQGRAADPSLDGDVAEFLEDLLTQDGRSDPELDFILRLQQFTGAVMAKGAEDTAFYTYNRLLSLNEVGGDPGTFGVPVTGFHRWCELVAMQHPRSMLATSTHDTKRGEDARLRISLLSEIPKRWGEAVKRWSAMNERHRTAGMPDRNLEYAIYQTLVGAWPIGRERLEAFALKAAREAKRHTSWTLPSEPYEQAVSAFVRRILESEPFTRDLAAFVAPLVLPARIHSLAQVLLKLAAPGVPDFYQGADLWEASLVDPDNRRPVDFDVRRERLAALDRLTAREALARMDEGLPKLLLIRCGLALRRALPDVFDNGGYKPLPVRGDRGIHAIAFSRGGRVAAVAPRLVLGLGGDWGDAAVELPEGRWRHAVTGDFFENGYTPLGGLFSRFPVALLAREEEA